MEQESTLPNVILDLIASEIKIKAEDGNEKLEIRILGDGSIHVNRFLYLGDDPIIDIFIFSILDEKSFRFYSYVTCEDFSTKSIKTIVITDRPDIVTALEDLKEEFY